jgi:nicotinamide phosphoribosyltransferase
MMYRTPFQYADSYKLSHWIQYPKDVAHVYSNLTPRRGTYCRTDRFVFFGLQAFLRKLETTFARDFFSVTREEAVEDFRMFYHDFFGEDPTSAQIGCVENLHSVGYLPLVFKALPEGTVVRHGIPVLTVMNTDPRLPWLTNFIESWMSAEVWGPCTSATTAFNYRCTFDRYASETSEQDFMPEFQGHDFSFRGMFGLEASSMSSAAHLLSFKGTDSLHARNWIIQNYDANCYFNMCDWNPGLGTSVPATEHSVMSAGGEDSEEETFSRLLELYPTGILSVVSDTWDFWGVVTGILPRLKEKIMARDGKLVIRPDSSPKTPVEILVGDAEAASGTPEHMGLIECLYATFGGTVNSKGYKQLDSHVGAIYGDSITLDYQDAILEGLMRKGFSSTNVVLGIGSYTYQHVTRDTHGIAVKATAVILRDGTARPIFKAPKTDMGMKKSLRGFLSVVNTAAGFDVIELGTPEPAPGDCLQTVWENGQTLRTQTFDEVRGVLAGYRREEIGGL